ncbi:MAG: hypothetical protein ASARMPRED_002576 [Alectoria sarmentosa]|nr:MAG: hypothetical protein ASARMPRED_002576 [Alectoria sarmentosa]
MPSSDTYAHVLLYQAPPKLRLALRSEREPVMSQRPQKRYFPRTSEEEFPSNRSGHERIPPRRHPARNTRHDGGEYAESKTDTLASSKFSKAPSEEIPKRMNREDDLQNQEPQQFEITRMPASQDPRTQQGFAIVDC